MVSGSQIRALPLIVAAGEIAMTTLLIVPGWQGSGPDHWQSLWESEMPEAIRVEQEDWEKPVLVVWLANLKAAVDKYPDSILVTHSLGCILLAHFVDRYPESAIRAAMIVSPPDTEEIAPIEDVLRDFAPIPRRRFPFPSVVVASEDDPYITITRARFFATRWGAGFIDVGRKGHINAESNLGDWPQGKAILKELIGRVEEQ